MEAKKDTFDFAKETQKSIGERIRQLWVISGEQQDEFVKLLGISTVTLSNYMNGKRKPDSEFLFAFKKKLNIRIDWLLTGEGPMNPDAPAPKQEATQEQPVTPARTTGHCAQCAELKTELEEERRERRELSAENRQLWKQNALLREECATLAERQKTCCPDPFLRKPKPSAPSSEADLRA